MKFLEISLWVLLCWYTWCHCWSDSCEFYYCDIKAQSSGARYTGSKQIPIGKLLLYVSGVLDYIYIWYWQRSFAQYMNSLISRDMDLCKINSTATASLTHEMVGNITCAVVILSLVMLTVCICCIFIRITDDDEVRIEDISLGPMPLLHAPDNERVLINASRGTVNARLEVH